jgi:hypothetical protein
MENAAPRGAARHVMASSTQPGPSPIEPESRTRRRNSQSQISTSWDDPPPTTTEFAIAIQDEGPLGIGARTTAAVANAQRIDLLQREAARAASIGEALRGGARASSAMAVPMTHRAAPDAATLTQPSAPGVPQSSGGSCAKPKKAKAGRPRKITAVIESRRLMQEMGAANPASASATERGEEIGQSLSRGAKYTAWQGIFIEFTKAQEGRGLLKANPRGSPGCGKGIRYVTHDAIRLFTGVDEKSDP